jgi:hypothetical protein
MLTAEAIKVRLQPVGFQRMVSTDGDDRTPALVRVVKKHRPITSQP